jgi:hypothetical protein
MVVVSFLLGALSACLLILFLMHMEDYPEFRNRVWNSFTRFLLEDIPKFLLALALVFFVHSLLSENPTKTPQVPSPYIDCASESLQE